MRLDVVFSPRGLRFAIPAMALALLGAGVLFSVVEKGHALGPLDGIWWAVTTVTTVGYGDVVPHTWAGRVLGAAVMIVGVGFLLLMTGAFVEHFIRGEIRRDVGEEIRRDLAGLAASIDSIDRRLARLEAAGAEPHPTRRVTTLSRGATRPSLDGQQIDDLAEYLKSL